MMEDRRSGNVQNERDPEWDSIYTTRMKDLADFATRLAKEPEPGPEMIRELEELHSDHDIRRLTFLAEKTEGKEKVSYQRELLVARLRGAKTAREIRKSCRELVELSEKEGFFK